MAYRAADDATGDCAKHGTGRTIVVVAVVGEGAGRARRERNRGRRKNFSTSLQHTYLLCSISNKTSVRAHAMPPSWKSIHGSP